MNHVRSAQQGLLTGGEGPVRDGALGNAAENGPHLVAGAGKGTPGVGGGLWPSSGGLGATGGGALGGGGGGGGGGLGLGGGGHAAVK